MLNQQNYHSFLRPFNVLCEIMNCFDQLITFSSSPQHGRASSSQNQIPSRQCFSKYGLSTISLEFALWLGCRWNLLKRWFWALQKTHWLESGHEVQEFIIFRVIHVPLFKICCPKGFKIGHCRFPCVLEQPGSSAVSMKVNPICRYHYSEGKSEEIGFPAVTMKEAFQGLGQGSCMWRDRSHVGKPGRRERRTTFLGIQVDLS